MGVTVPRTRTRADNTAPALHDRQVTACRQHPGAARFGRPLGAGAHAVRLSGERHESLGYRVAPRAERPQEDRPLLAVPSVEVRTPGRPAPSGSGVCALLPPRPVATPR